MSLHKTGDEAWDSPEMRAWTKRVLDELVPMIADTAITVSMVPKSGTDIKFAVELGVSIMLDKPIILAIRPGVEVSDHLRRVADEIVEVSMDNHDGLVHAINRTINRLHNPDVD